ncbi:Cyclin-A2-3 [Sarracenia purpurea var. burkii]
MPYGTPKANLKTAAKLGPGHRHAVHTRLVGHARSLVLWLLSARTGCALRSAICWKYEEICAPRVEEFCFITDNTYAREEVLKMECQVLNYLGFQLSAPTAQTFLRRFLRAAQAYCKPPSLELEYLANYLAELTLVDFEFLKFLPSIIAASAVFLARWTLDQSGNPWNATLEHYTNYKASDLKLAVHALRCLQLNTNGCPLNAIRAKYKQAKVRDSVRMVEKIDHA